MKPKTDTYTARRDEEINNMVEAFRVALKGSPLLYNRVDEITRKVTLFVADPTDQNFTSLIIRASEYVVEGRRSRS